MVGTSDGLQSAATARQRQAAALRAAARRKADEKRVAAQRGLRDCIAEAEKVTFAAVARRAGVSTRYLRTQQDLAQIIVHLRGAHPTAGAPIGARDLSIRISLLEQLLQELRIRLSATTVGSDHPNGADPERCSALSRQER
jgi:hypothetical protein